MASPIIKRYKIPVLIALVVSLAIIALGAIDNPLSAVFAFLGALLGIIILDLEYILQVYLVDPKDPHAVEVKQLLANKNVSAYVDYINRNEYDFGEIAIRSAIFQVLLMIFTVYVIVTNGTVFAQSMLMSMSGALLYQQFIEFHKIGDFRRWFWFYNGSIPRAGYIVYMILSLIVLIYQFSLL